jgi:hypothetical protein
MDYEEIWENIIESLRGTCNSMASVLEQYNRLDLENHLPFHNYVDHSIFLCDTCGWWCEMSEMADNDRWECESCSELH